MTAGGKDVRKRRNGNVSKPEKKLLRYKNGKRGGRIVPREHDGKPQRHIPEAVLTEAREKQLNRCAA